MQPPYFEAISLQQRLQHPAPGGGCRACVGLGLTAVWFAVGVPCLLDPARFGDLSYGLFIVHFPIIQGAIVAGLFAGSFAIGMAASLGIAIVVALLLWWLVERPALWRGSPYRSAR